MKTCTQTKNIKDWILVTGAIRSGTTFLGSILSYPIQVDYIHEPFNPQCGMPGITLGHRYIRPVPEAICRHPYHPIAKSIFDYSLSLKTYCPDSDAWPKKMLKQVFGSRGPFYLRLAKLNPFHSTAVIKDPHAVLLTEYLAKTFAVKPVIVIKHPISFLASLKRVNWWPSPSEIGDQPELTEDYFLSDPMLLKKNWQSSLLESAAFWRCIHKVLLKQMSCHPEWLMVTHEDLSQNPLFHFKQLYESLNLPWSFGVEKKIIHLTQGNRSATAKNGRVQDFRRNSADIFKVSCESLTLEERRAVFEVVEDVALQLYSRESFSID